MISLNHPEDFCAELFLKQCVVLEKKQWILSSRENKSCLWTLLKKRDYHFSASCIDSSTTYSSHTSSLMEKLYLPPSPIMPPPPPLSVYFCNQLWACFLPHPNKWVVNPAGTAGWKWVLKGISKWHFNKDVCGDIMGPNESNVFRWCADSVAFSQLYPCLSLMGRVKEKTEGDEIWGHGPVGDLKMHKDSLWQGSWHNLGN